MAPCLDSASYQNNSRFLPGARRKSSREVCLAVVVKPSKDASWFESTLLHFNERLTLVIVLPNS